MHYGLQAQIHSKLKEAAVLLERKKENAANSYELFAFVLKIHYVL